MKYGTFLFLKNKSNWEYTFFNVISIPKEYFSRCLWFHQDVSIDKIRQTCSIERSWTSQMALEERRKESWHYIWNSHRRKCKLFKKDECTFPLGIRFRWKNLVVCERIFYQIWHKQRRYTELRLDKGLFDWVLADRQRNWTR